MKCRIPQCVVFTTGGLSKGSHWNSKMAAEFMRLCERQIYLTPQNYCLQNDLMVILGLHLLHKRKAMSDLSKSTYWAVDISTNSRGYGSGSRSCSSPFLHLLQHCHALHPSCLADATHLHSSIHALHRLRSPRPLADPRSQSRVSPALHHSMGFL